MESGVKLSFISAAIVRHFERITTCAPSRFIESWSMGLACPG